MEDEPHILGGFSVWGHMMISASASDSAENHDLGEIARINLPRDSFLDLESDIKEESLYPGVFRPFTASKNV
jgi:hypothetical protein